MRVLYMFGLNEDGQCAVTPRSEHNGRYFPIPIAFPLRVTITTVSAGSRHTLALTSAGEVFSWGWGHLGQLGHGDVRNYHQPVKIPTLQNVNFISAGGVHSACINVDNYCYTWGSCTYGQLGLGIEYTRTKKCIVSTPTVVTLRSSQQGEHVKGEKYFSRDKLSEASLNIESSQAVIGPEFPPHALRATRISCGGLHTAAIDMHGNVYCWGKADSGQTGYADWYQAFSAAVCIPRKVEGLGPRLRGGSLGSPIGSPQVRSKSGLQRKPSGNNLVEDQPGLDLRAVEVSCGGFHTMVTMQDGSVYAMGKQDFGMLGTGPELSVSIDIGAEAPTLVKYNTAYCCSNNNADIIAAPINAKQVRTGGWHTAVVDSEGVLYMCGKGEYGRLGLGDEKSRMLLTQVRPAQHVAVLSNVKAPLLPTLPENSPLCGSQASSNRDTPTQTTAPPPAPAASLVADKVTSVSAGGSHTVWTTESGKVFTVGRLDGGRLGMGFLSSTNPARVDSDSSISNLTSFGKKKDRLLTPVDITPMLYVCCAGRAKCQHRLSEAASAEARVLPAERYSVLQVEAGGSHTAILVDYPEVPDEALGEFVETVEANILNEEARVDPANIPTVK